MAYNRTKWQDHVVERPRTFTEVTNADGSVTHTPAPGEVLQQGTPQSATNFNNIEDALSIFRSRSTCMPPSPRHSSGRRLTASRSLRHRPPP